ICRICAEREREPEPELEPARPAPLPVWRWRPEQLFVRGHAAARRSGAGVESDIVRREGRVRIGMTCHDPRGAAVLRWLLSGLVLTGVAAGEERAPHPIVGFSAKTQAAERAL